jgi:hypothetical protein
MTSKNKLVKQLNSAMGQVRALEQRMVRNMNTDMSRKPRRQRAPRANTSTNVPLNVATTLRNNAPNRVHTETGREQIGVFTVTALTPVGASVKVLLNPLLLSGTRLQKLASVYQKFRFTSATLNIQSSASTIVRGLYVAGYNSNPDAEFSPSRAVQFVSTLPGSISSNVWLSQRVRAQLQDRAKWYNLDADSEEIMMTTQGYFAVVNQVSPNIDNPGDLTFPLWLDYTVQFTGTAANATQTGPAILFPNGQFTWTGLSSDYTFVVDPAENLGVPSTSSGQIYSINPAYAINTGGAGGEPEYATAVRVYVSGYGFASTLEDLNAGKFIIGTSTTPSPVLRAQWTLLN